MATWRAALSRNGPGLLLHELRTAPSDQARAAVAVIAALQADVLLLTDVDYDPGLAALDALAGLLEAAGSDYPHRMALRPNAGVATGFDLDGDGRLGRAEDAQGWGRFPGDGGMAILSRLPFDTAATRDHSGFLWRDLPAARGPVVATEDGRAVQRLASRGAWDVAVEVPGGGVLRVLAFHAAPPLAAAADRDLRRNHDEVAFWTHLLDGVLPLPAPEPPFVLMGIANADPADGLGDAAALRRLLAHPALRDPIPRGGHGRQEPDHQGDPALDTALVGSEGAERGLRLDFVLPSAGLEVRASGGVWPQATDPLLQVLTTAGRHRPVWVEIALP
ncbi:MAG TPA: endonuclease/exonuclease/phosphatase family protein [Paracoccaceae bacterium]|nr:endonuclease/exonuclease/phosphatase family protein [Paracoccaceae bacterium]